MRGLGRQSSTLPGLIWILTSMRGLLRGWPGQTPVATWTFWQGLEDG
jgi:hypothetical protein